MTTKTITSEELWEEVDQLQERLEIEPDAQHEEVTELTEVLIKICLCSRNFEDW